MEVVIEDDESSPEKAAFITEKFCADRTVDIVLGPYSSGLTVAAAKAALSRKRTLWNHGGAADEISGYENTVNAITPASRYFITVLEILKRSGGKKIVMANAHDSGFSKSVADGAEKRAWELGMNVCRFEYFSGTADFETVLRELETGGGALLSCGRMEDDIALAAKVLSMKKRPGFLCFVAAGVEDFVRHLGEKSEGVFSVSQWEEDNTEFEKPDFGPSSFDFAEIFRREYGRPPDYPAAQAFNIGLIVQKCVSESQNTNDKLLRETAKKLDFTTFYGKFCTDTDGRQTGHTMVVTKWKNGKRVVVEPMGFEPTTSSMPLMRSPN